jgi:NAD(P)-dependent dehydrogenase (short-subunit alcohol dehydrogenase family)
MKSVAVTGHTDGIGLELFLHYLSKGMTMVGFSRRTGYDISQDLHRKRILEKSQDCDMFINNAYHRGKKENYQFMLFEEMFNLWKDKDKIIVNISSTAGDFPHPARSYNTNKNQLDQRCNQLSNQKHQVQIINIKPGYTDTPHVALINEPKLKPHSISAVLDYILDFRQQGRISSITVYPNLDVDSPSKSLL